MDTDHFKLFAITGTGVTVANLQLGDWVNLLTCIFLILQVGLLIPKWISGIKSSYKRLL